MLDQIKELESLPGHREMFREYMRELQAGRFNKSWEERESFEEFFEDIVYDFDLFRADLEFELTQNGVMADALRRRIYGQG